MESVSRSPVPFSGALSFSQHEIPGGNPFLCGPLFLIVRWRDVRSLENISVSARAVTDPMDISMSTTSANETNSPQGTPSALRFVSIPVGTRQVSRGLQFLCSVT